VLAQAHRGADALEAAALDGHSMIRSKNACRSAAAAFHLLEGLTWTVRRGRTNRGAFGVLAIATWAVPRAR
jgi:hypothetical protein